MKSKSSLVTLLVPYGLWSIVFLLIPLTIIFLYSLCQRGSHGELQWVWTLENFVRVFDPIYLKIVRNSLILAVVNTCGCLLLGYPMAYYMAFSRRETKMVLLFLIMIPFWTSFMVRIYAWVVLLGESGIINQFLLKLGIISTPLPFLFRPHSILLGLLYNYLPFMILPIFVTLERLDPALLEAAQDLGATSARRFFRVTLPLSFPGIVAGALLVFIPSLGEFVIPEILGGGKYPMIGNLIAMQYLTHRDWPFGSALSLLLTLTVLIGLLLTRGKGTKGGLLAAAV